MPPLKKEHEEIEAEPSGDGAELVMANGESERAGTRSARSGLLEADAVQIDLATTVHAQWRLSFWARRRDEAGEGRSTDIWCTSEREARLRFGEYRRIFESHTLIITRVELLSPSGRKITSV